MCSFGCSFGYKITRQCPKDGYALGKESGPQGEKWLRFLGLFSPEKRRLRGGLMAACGSSKGAEGQYWSFPSGNNNRTWGNVMELHRGRIRLGITKRFFTKRVVVHWNRLPRAAVTAPSLLKFKNCLDKALRYRIWYLGGPLLTKNFTNSLVLIMISHKRETSRWKCKYRFVLLVEILTTDAELLGQLDFWISWSWRSLSIWMVLSFCDHLATPRNPAQYL